MASAAPQKRMVASVFINLASPFKATVTPTAHSAPCRRDVRASDAVVSSAPPTPDDLPLPPPPPRDPCDPDPRPPAAPAQESTVGKVLLRSAPSAGGDVNDVCGFCRKPVPLSEPAIEALNRTYHAECFQCRQCHAPLAGKIYYNRSGIPLCDDCYQVCRVLLSPEPNENGCHPLDGKMLCRPCHLNKPI